MHSAQYPSIHPFSSTCQRLGHSGSKYTGCPKTSLSPATLSPDNLQSKVPRRHPDTMSQITSNVPLLTTKEQRLCSPPYLYGGAQLPYGENPFLLLVSTNLILPVTTQSSRPQVRGPEHRSTGQPTALPCSSASSSPQPFGYLHSFFLGQLLNPNPGGEQSTVFWQRDLHNTEPQYTHAPLHLPISLHLL